LKKEREQKHIVQRQYNEELEQARQLRESMKKEQIEREK